MEPEEPKLPDVRPDPDPEPDLPLVKSSVVVQLNDGKQKRFPSLQDYVDQLVEQGIVKDLDDLVANYSHLIGEMFINWVATGQVGCLFAVKLARNPRLNRWVPIVQLGALSHGDSLDEVLNEQLDAVAEHHEAAVLIFPDVVRDADIARLVALLCEGKSGRWYRTEHAKSDNEAVKLVELRWILPSGNSVNLVLGFSSLPTMPVTRRSPFTAMFFRLKDRKRQKEEREDGRMIVHLADLDSTFRPQKWHDIVWERTKAMKKLYVQPELGFAARAKITFTIAADAAKNLPKPRQTTITN